MEPGADPDYQLGINTCDALPTKTDGSGATSMDYWCDPEFDRLFAQQHAELDPPKRQEIVKQMQAIHYDAAPSIDFWYPESLEAFRSDKFTGLTKMPQDGGVLTGQSGYWALLDAKPVGADGGDAAGDSGGLGTGAGSVSAPSRSSCSAAARCSPAVAAPPPTPASDRRPRRGGRRGRGQRPRRPRGHQPVAVRRAQGRRRLPQPRHGGGPGLLRLPDPARDDPAIDLTRGRIVSPEQLETMRRQFGLDEPVLTQFGIYLRDLPRGRLGDSYTYRRPVADLIAEHIGATLLLTGVSAAIAIGLGLWIGQRAAWRRGTWFDRLNTGTALVLWSVPTFWLGLILLLVFGGMLQWLPTGGFKTAGMTRPGSPTSSTCCTTSRCRW